MFFQSCIDLVSNYYLQYYPVRGLYISLTIVLVGTILCLFFSFPLRSLIQTIRVPFQILSNFPSLLDTISMIVHFSEQARREGILTLEGTINNIGHPHVFMKRGLNLASDRVEPELIKKILQTDLAFSQDRHKEYQNILTFTGKIVLEMGIVSLLINLILLFLNLDHSISFFTGLAVSLSGPTIATLLAFFIFFPLAEKLRWVSSLERLDKEIIIEAVMSIQSGDNPRILEEKLLSFLPPYMRTLPEENNLG